VQAVNASREVKTTNAASGAERNPQDDYSSINPRVGVTYALTDNHQLFANASRLFEPPTTFELDDDVRGNNETLDPMHGTVVEVGSRGEMPFGAGNRWHWETAVYYAQIRDEILSMDDPAAPGNSLSTNIDKTTHAGIEALLGASFALGASSTVEPLLSVTYNDFHFDGDAIYSDNELPAAPDFVVRGEILYRQANGFYIGPTFDIVGERYADFTNSYQVDSYELLGVRTGYDAKTWEVFAELKNLTDEDYVSTLSVLDSANANSAILYPGAPLSVYAGIRMQF
jgi:iron complex outermembrane receptor protein